MFAQFREWQSGRNRARVTAECLVWHFGGNGVDIARLIANAPGQSPDVRRLNRAVVRIALSRYRLLRDLDVGTRYELGQEWARRYAAMIRLPPVAEA